MGDKEYIVYLHINKINRNVYVGITHYTNPEKRWRQGNGYKNNPIFNKAIRKYGWDGFNHCILFKRLSKDIACNIERTLILKYKKSNISYNIADGGDGVHSMNDYIRSKISNSCKGKRVGDKNPMKHLTAEQREFHSQKMKRTWQNREEMLTRLRAGIQKSREKGMYKGNRNKMPNHVKEAIRASTIKPVMCFSKEGVFIKEYESISQANMELGINKKSSSISRVCKGERKTAHGFIWMFKEKEVTHGYA